MKAAFSGTLEVPAPIEQAFPLFSPPGERDWVPGWDPEYVHPPGSAWEEGQVFRTREERGEAVWVVARLDHEGHAAEYYRVEPGRYVAHITVRCREKAAGLTEVATTYAFTGLSDIGDGDIAAMTQADYDAKMTRWAGCACLPRGSNV